MTYNIYAVQDLKTNFGNPFVDVNDESAVRGFRFAFANSGNLYNFSPRDFVLMRIGTFDADTGVVEPCIPTVITNGVAVSEEVKIYEE